MPDYNIDFFKELRRQAFVSCIEKKLSGNPMAGTFASVDTSIIRGFGITPIPIISIDSAIFAYGERTGACDAIDATSIYLTTGKCPLLFAIDCFVMDNICPYFIKRISSLSNKKIYINHNLKAKLLADGFVWSEQEYQKALHLQHLIDSALHNLCKSDIDSKLLSYVMFYINYEIVQEKQLQILHDLLAITKNTHAVRQIISVSCPNGILYEIKGRDYLLRESTKNPDYAPDGCVFCYKNYIKYGV